MSLDLQVDVECLEMMVLEVQKVNLVTGDNLVHWGQRANKEILVHLVFLA